MINAFLKLSLRNLFRKNRLFTMVNITGLSIGFAALLLVCLYIYNEYSFDRYHKNAARIHRVVVDFTSEGNTVNWARTSAPIGQYLIDAYPEIEEVVRIRKNTGTDLLTRGEIQFYEERILFADSSLFKIFDFNLKSGNPITALSAPNSVVITETLAKKYFKDEDPINQTIRFNNAIDLKITGILNEVPASSHFVADAFIAFSTLKELFGEQRLAHWGQFDHYTYLLLSEGSTPAEADGRFPDLLKKHAPAWVGEKEKLFLQPLTSIHLHSDRKDEITPNSRETYSYVLGTIALFILLMAIVNFINLSSAVQTARMKETAIQKILGARKRDLTIYFIIESIVLCLVSIGVAIGLAWWLLPYFNTTTGKQIVLTDAGSFLLYFFGLALLIALASAIVPAIQSWSDDFVRARHTQMKSKARTRAALITFQLSVSIILLSSTLIVSSQSQFLSSSQFGFRSDDIIIIPVKDRSQNGRYAAFVSQIESLPGVLKACYSSSSPGSDNAFTYTYTISGSDKGEQPMATFLVDENFLDLYNIEVVSGRELRPLAGDTLADVLINEAAARHLGLNEPLGQVVRGKVKGKIVGVVKDFNHGSLHSSVAPVILYAFPPTYRFVSVKLRSDDIQAAIAALEYKWPELYPGYPLEYTFHDEQMRKLYESEYRLTKAYTSFSVIAIIIASIGLVGLTTYLTARKQKEIGIRKVFGGSDTQLIGWIYTGYFKIILGAVIISWVVSYYWMSRWLNQFPFKIEITIFHVVMPPLIMVAVLFLATGFQTLRAIAANPVETLREE